MTRLFYKAIDIRSELVDIDAIQIIPHVQGKVIDYHPMDIISFSNFVSICINLLLYSSSHYKYVLLCILFCTGCNNLLIPSLINN